MSFNASAKAHTGRQGDINPDVGKGTDGRVYWQGYEVKGDKIFIHDYSQEWLESVLDPPFTSTKDGQHEMASQKKKPHSK